MKNYSPVPEMPYLVSMSPVAGHATGILSAFSKLLKRAGRAGAEDAILPYVGHLQLISTLKIVMPI